MSESNGINGAGANGIGNGADPEPVSGTAAAADLAARTLTGDLRDWLLRFVRDQRAPWHLLGEEQQTKLAARIEGECEDLVRRTVEIVGARNFRSIGVALDQVAFKPRGIEAKMTFGAMDAATRHALVDAQGGRVVIVVVDPDLFRGARGLAAIERDEPELPLAIGAGEPENGPTEETDAPADEEDNPAEGPGEVATPDSEDGPAHSRDSYSEGYEAAKGDAGVDANPYEWLYPQEPEYRAALLWLAGWYQARLDVTTATLARNDLCAEAVQAFNRLGREAADYDLGDERKSAGERVANPLDLWMPACQWWTQGYLDACAGAGTSDKPPPSVEPPKRGRGRPRKSGGDQPGASA